MSGKFQTKRKSPSSIGLPLAGVLQRKCACGGMPGPAGECESCRKKKLQRGSVKVDLSPLNHRPSSASEVPPIVNEVLHSPDQPLDTQTRAFIQPRFGHDFGEVRVHTKLAINEPGDKYEQEADRIASYVLAAPGQGEVGRAPLHIQRRRGQPAGRADNSVASADRTFASFDKPLNRGLGVDNGSAGIRESGTPPHGEREERLMITPEFQSKLEDSKGFGQSLNDLTKNEMQSKIGHDFSDVRVHTGIDAHTMSDSLNARAFTHGQDIFFAGSQSPNNKALLAHELVHTVQQRGSARKNIQRAMKLEIQTGNVVWAVKNTGATDPRRLPRKYTATTVGYEEGAGQEQGDQPAFLSVGPHGQPARKANIAYVEVEGPSVMKKAKDAESSKEAQFVTIFKFNAQVKVKDILGKPVTWGQMKLVTKIDNSKIAAIKDKFNPNTYEFKYLNADGKELAVHLDQQGLFKEDHVKLMKVGKGHRQDIDYDKTAQIIETWKVTLGNGPLTFNGKSASAQQVGKAKDNEISWKKAQAENPQVKVEKDYNPGTYERNYFLSTQFSGDTLLPGAKRLKVHLSKDGSSLKEGHVEFLEKRKVPKAEQTAIELQSETDGVLEFETPKWFNNLPELRLRIQDAVDMTKAIDASVELKYTAENDKKILKAIASKPAGTKGRIVKWPDIGVPLASPGLPVLSTKHLTNLAKDKRSLFVQIVDKTWNAKIQSSYEVSLSQYQTLLSQHDQWDGVNYAAAAISNAQSILNAGFAHAKAFSPAELAKLGIKNLHLTNVNKEDLVNLLGFLQIITDYLIHGQYRNLSSSPAKDLALVMSRTSFYSMYRSILGETERLLFRFMVKKGTIPKTLEGPLNAFLTANKKSSTPAAVAANFAAGDAFVYRTGHRKGAGPKIKDWLESIVFGYRSGDKTIQTDKLSPPDQGSLAMGAVRAGSELGEENIARFEVRYSQSLFGGQVKTRDEWVGYAESLFRLAAQRKDTPDNPLTPDVNEAAKTGLEL